MAEIQQILKMPVLSPSQFRVALSHPFFSFLTARKHGYREKDEKQRRESRCARLDIHDAGSGATNKKKEMLLCNNGECVSLYYERRIVCYVSPR